MKTALTIAGSDPTGGAGFQADLKTFWAMGVLGLSVPSVLTAQNTRGVSGVNEISPEFFSHQLDILLCDIKPDALKTGMLHSEEIVRLVIDKVRTYELTNLVIDPVIISSTGVRLLDEGGVELMKTGLLPLCSVITPNIHEASSLTGMEIRNESDRKDAAIKLVGDGAGAAIITGGHLNDKAEDLLFDGEEFYSIGHDLMEGEYHGTGCVFSSVITACLAQGHGVKYAFVKAKDFVRQAIITSLQRGKGMKLLNI